MTTYDSDDQHLRPHPVLSRLLNHDQGTDARVFRGYVGPASDSGRVRLYPSLGDLTFSIDIDEADIIASAAAPESILPHGGAVIWVKPDAEVVCHGEQVTTVSARRVRRGATADVFTTNAGAAASAAGRPVVEVQTGRLNIRLRRRVMSTCASCSCSSCETHPSCHSTCNQARGSVVLGP
jgi:hypothetical protein